MSYRRALLSILAGTSLAAADIPLGSKDFYPSPEHPIGFLGDGTSYYPGATPVSIWQEGTPKSQVVPNKPHSDVTIYRLADDKKVNIVWKTTMPGWVNSEPIVVGDLVFTHAEPNQLVCVDANSGKILWTRATNPYAAEGSPVKDPEQMQTLHAIYQVLADFKRYFSTNQSPSNWPVLKEHCTIFAATVIPRLAIELKKVDPTGNYADAVAKTATAYNTAATAFNDAKPKPDTRGLPFETKDCDVLCGAVSRRMSELGGFGKGRAFDVPWGSMIGWMMSVPVSDGRRVYTSLGQGALACYDLTGKLLWSRWTPELLDKGRSYSVQSPLLVDGVVVSMLQGAKELVAFDAITGKDAWRAPTKGDYDKFGSKSGYFVGSHGVMALKGSDGKPINVIITTLCNIIRAKDGKSLGFIPYSEGGLSGGSTIQVSGDIIMKGSAGDGFACPYVAYQLAFDGPEKVVAKELWRLPNYEGYKAKIATPDRFVLDGVAYESATGKKIFDAQMKQCMSQALFGDMLFGIPEANWWSPQTTLDEGRLANTFRTWKCEGQKVTPLQTTNILGGIPKVHYVEYDTYAPELMADPNFHHNWGGPPGHNLHTDNAVFASGNRIFIRTVADLYCIGDPAVKYDWNPDSRPKDIVVPDRSLSK